MDLTIEELIEKYSNLIKNISTQLAQDVNYLNIDFEDLYQVGCLELIESYHKYNPDRGSLTTFVYNTVKYGMLDYINKNNYVITVPINVSSGARLVSRIKYKYMQEYGQKISEQELLDILKEFKLSTLGRKATLDYIREIDVLNSYYFYPLSSSLDQPNELENCDGYSKTEYLGDFVASDDDVERAATDKVLAEQIFNYILQLDDRSKFIIINKLGLTDDIPKSLRKIDETLDIGFRSVGHCYDKALRKIKEKFNI